MGKVHGAKYFLICALYDTIFTGYGSSMWHIIEREFDGPNLVGGHWCQCWSVEDTEYHMIFR